MANNRVQITNQLLFKQTFPTPEKQSIQQMGPGQNTVHLSSSSNDESFALVHRLVICFLTFYR